MKLISDDPAKRNKEILMAMLIVLCFIYIGCNAGNICNKKNPNPKRLPKLKKTKNTELLELSLQKLGNNNLNQIFQFLDPKDTEYAVREFLSKTQKKDFPHFRRRENPGDAIRYFPEEAIEYIPDKYGSHVFPFALKNIKQMFTFDTSTGLVKQFYGSNLVYLTLSHDGDLEIKFDGQISNKQNKQLFKNIDSVSFVSDIVFSRYDKNSITFNSWKKQFSPDAVTQYFDVITLELKYKNRSSFFFKELTLISHYIEIKRSKSKVPSFINPVFLGFLNVVLL